MISVRHAIALLLVTTGCFRSAAETALDDNAPLPEGVGGCRANDDCQAVGATCCDCPTFATSVDDPKASACTQVECPQPNCPANVEAACDVDRSECVLQCKPLACAASCAAGFASSANGCLSCDCAAPTAPATPCFVDGDCARTRKDCCGCARGGQDTAVLVADVAEFDNGLMCGAAPACPDPQTSSCAPDEAPRCIRGRCELLPDPPSDACGSSDLGECEPGKICTVNVNDQATLYGLGVCRSP